MKKIIFAVLIASAALIAGCAKDSLPVPTEPLETVTPRTTATSTMTATPEASSTSTGILTATPTATVTPELTATPTSTVTMSPTQTSTPYTAQIKCLDADPSLCSAKDTMLIHNAPANNYGAFTMINVGAYGAAGDKRRGLFYFDVSSIPSNAVITEARFYFNVETFDPQNGTSLSVLAHVVDSAWGEMTETWDTNSGGDYSSQIGAANVSSTGGWVLFLTTATVQGWVSGTSSNYGFILISQTESTATGDDVIIISSKEAVSTAARPYLQVKYTLP